MWNPPHSGVYHLFYFVELNIRDSGISLKCSLNRLIENGYFLNGNTKKLSLLDGVWVVRDKNFSPHVQVRNFPLQKTPFRENLTKLWKEDLKESTMVKELSITQLIKDFTLLFEHD